MMNHRLVVALLAIVLFQSGAPARPQQDLAQVDTALARYIDEGKIAGAVVLVLRDGRLAFQRAVGWADKDGGVRMGADAIFRIASETKPITSVAIMMLAEEKKLSLDDEVGKYLPAFEKTTVAVKTDTGLALVEAEHEITIRHLLTHTAGISYGTDSQVAPLYKAQGLGTAAGFGWYLADKSATACETVDRLGRLPFVAQPGDAYVYGYSTDVLGCIVEKVSGMSLDEFFRQRIVNPLRMPDTHFFPPLDKARRLATVYSVGEDGKIRRAPDGALGQGDYVEGPRKSFSGGAGLVTTARDYGRFLQMLLNRGELDGVRILSKKSVDEMTKNQVDDLYGTEGLGFGFGVETVETEGAKGPFPEGTYGGRGAYGCRYVVVPEAKMIIVVMVQLLPYATDFRDTIPELIYSTLAP